MQVGGPLLTESKSSSDEHVRIPLAYVCPYPYIKLHENITFKVLINSTSKGADELYK